jgi:hypothetical protein
MGRQIGPTRRRQPLHPFPVRDQDERWHGARGDVFYPSVMTARPGWDNASHAATLRTRADQLAPTNWKEALAVARSIDLPWYRAQAISYVAQHAPDDQVESLLKRAQDTAAEDTDQYRRVGVLAWVVEAAIVRNRPEYARKVLAKAHAATETVTPLKSRATALELLLQRGMPLGKIGVHEIARDLLRVAENMRSGPAGALRKWGASYINRVASYLPAVIAEELIAERFGAEKARAVVAKHSSALGRG